MSWEPSRSSGIMYDKFARKAHDNEVELIHMIQTNEYLNFDKMNKFSKHLYLFWLNENKKHCALVSRSFNKDNPRYDLLACCKFECIYNMLVRNKEKLYKPLQAII